MTIFKSRQVNLDPEPWWYENSEGDRQSKQHGPNDTFHPRPEFEPTRDPEPWVNTFGNRVGSPGRTDDGEFRWAPRREQFDTPVNRVLALFRTAWDDDDDEDARYELTLRWFEALGNTASWQSPCEYTTDEIDHARRVMARLWGWEGRVNG